MLKAFERLKPRKTENCFSHRLIGKWFETQNKKLTQMKNLYVQ